MIIDDATPGDVIYDPAFSRGMEPRDFAADPPETFAPPKDIPLIPESEWDARIDEQESQRSSLEHVVRRALGGRPIPSLDQNGQGFCWAYSTGHALIAARARDNQPYVRLSPHAVACKIMEFRDRGGWCGLSAKFARETGYPSEEFWPQKSMRREHDNPETWADAARHKIVYDFCDLGASHFYYQNLTFQQLATCLLLNIPCPVDFNWWGHSVCALRLVRVERGSYGVRIWNSWSDAWGDSGMATLRGQRMYPNSALGVVGATVSS